MILFTKKESLSLFKIDKDSSRDYFLSMNQLKNYIPDRIRKLQDSLLPLREEYRKLEQKIAAAESELADLINAAKAIGIVNGLPAPPRGITRKTPPEKTIKEAALEVLQEFPNGLMALDLLAKINERYGLNLARTSLSPQLSRLKKERKIISKGSIWLLPSPPDLFLHTDKNTK